MDSVTQIAIESERIGRGILLWRVENFRAHRNENYRTRATSFEGNNLALRTHRKVKRIIESESDYFSDLEIRSRLRRPKLAGGRSKPKLGKPPAGIPASPSENFTRREINLAKQRPLCARVSGRTATTDLPGNLETRSSRAAFTRIERPRDIEFGARFDD
ncbi:hypothetical protein K0M31_015007 [Melipona bicolor]|uniref:Uncharacterized protein n=1 Tax=Melipona bicolor TaxID=60889 RepID=A0AA40FFZ5_9HYME|nr:hypothetical protein K0M31_015007 [Melipona bicolor]